MGIEVTTLKEWWRMKEERDMQMDRLFDALTVKKCPRCGGKYSFYKGTTDPSLCASCRGEDG